MAYYASKMLTRGVTWLPKLCSWVNGGDGAARIHHGILHLDKGSKITQRVSTHMEAILISTGLISFSTTIRLIYECPLVLAEFTLNTAIAADRDLYQRVNNHHQDDSTEGNWIKGASGVTSSTIVWMCLSVSPSQKGPVNKDNRCLSQ